VLVTLQTLVGKSNRMLASDLAIAAILADAAARSADWNVQINLSQLGDDEKRAACSKEANGLLLKCKGLAESIETSCRI
jgi:formiminotetrahydrofolate cyclodeaminase